MLILHHCRQKHQVNGLMKQFKIMEAELASNVKNMQKELLAKAHFPICCQLRLENLGSAYLEGDELHHCTSTVWFSFVLRNNCYHHKL